MSAVFRWSKDISLAFPTTWYAFVGYWSSLMAEPRPDPSFARRVGVREFRGNLASFLQQVQDGHRLVLTSHLRVVAQIGPSSPGLTVRKPGALRARIKVADDFDTPSADMLQARKTGREAACRRPRLALVVD